MKTRRNAALFLSLLIVFTLAACSRDDKVTPQNLSSEVPGTGWKVSLFSEPKENKTSDYNGYMLEFASDGTLKITGNGQTISGTWKQHQNDGVTKFLITIDTTDHHLSQLSSDWVVVSKTEKLIALRDDNAASNELLQFSK